jgi:hypothetical protein
MMKINKFKSNKFSKLSLSILVGIHSSILIGSASQAAICTHVELGQDLKKGFASCKEYQIQATIYIRSTVKFDGRGARITGVGAYKQCNQFPTNKAVFWIESSNNVLKNFTIVQSPEGIHVAKGNNNRLENIIFQKVCEDAITNGDNKNYNTSAHRTVVTGCSFYKGEDKAIQSNGGTMLIENSTFTDVARPISSCGHNADPGFHAPGVCPARSDLYVQNSVFVRSDNYALQAAGKYQSLVYSRKNTFKSPKQRPFRTQNNSKIYSAEKDCKSLANGDVICDAAKTNAAFLKF